MNLLKVKAGDIDWKILSVDIRARNFLDINNVLLPVVESGWKGVLTPRAQGCIVCGCDKIKGVRV